MAADYTDTAVSKVESSYTEFLREDFGSQPRAAAVNLEKY